MNDLEDLKRHWTIKYPQVSVNLWIFEDEDKFFGWMALGSNTTDLCSDTLSGLIEQGDNFLRKTMMGHNNEWFR